MLVPAWVLILLEVGLAVSATGFVVAWLWLVAAIIQADLADRRYRRWRAKCDTKRLRP